MHENLYVYGSTCPQILPASLVALKLIVPEGTTQRYTVYYRVSGKIGCVKFGDLAQNREFINIGEILSWATEHL